jgi:hypothetical protein
MWSSTHSAKPSSTPPSTPPAIPHVIRPSSVTTRSLDPPTQPVESKPIAWAPSSSCSVLIVDVEHECITLYGAHGGRVLTQELFLPRALMECVAIKMCEYGIETVCMPLMDLFLGASDALLHDTQNQQHQLHSKMVAMACRSLTRANSRVDMVSIIKVASWTTTVSTSAHSAHSANAISPNMPLVAMFPEWCAPHPLLAHSLKHLVGHLLQMCWTKVILQTVLPRPRPFLSSSSSSSFPNTSQRMEWAASVTCKDSVIRLQRLDDDAQSSMVLVVSRNLHLVRHVTVWRARTGALLLVLPGARVYGHLVAKRAVGASGDGLACAIDGINAINAANALRMVQTSNETKTTESTPLYTTCALSSLDVVDAVLAAMCMSDRHVIFWPRPSDPAPTTMVLRPREPSLPGPQQRTVSSSSIPARSQSTLACRSVAPASVSSLPFSKAHGREPGHRSPTVLATPHDATDAGSVRTTRLAVPVRRHADGGPQTNHDVMGTNDVVSYTIHALGDDECTAALSFLPPNIRVVLAYRADGQLVCLTYDTHCPDYDVSYVVLRRLALPAKRPFRTPDWISMIGTLFVDGWMDGDLPNIELNRRSPMSRTFCSMLSQVVDPWP